MDRVAPMTVIATKVIAMASIATTVIAMAIVGMAIIATKVIAMTLYQPRSHQSHRHTDALLHTDALHADASIHTCSTPATVILQLFITCAVTKHQRMRNKSSHA